MKAVRKRVNYIFWSAVYAFFIYQLTTIIYFSSGGDAFSAIIWNLIMILGFIIFEKCIVLFIYPRLKASYKKKPSAVNKLLKSYFTGPSFKAAMYFFYMLITVYTALNTASPDFWQRLVFPYGYLLSVRYGILFLIAADKFIEQVFKDVKEDEIAFDEVDEVGEENEADISVK